MPVTVRQRYRTLKRKLTLLDGELAIGVTNIG